MKQVAAKKAGDEERVLFQSREASLGLLVPHCRAGNRLTQAVTYSPWAPYLEDKAIQVPEPGFQPSGIEAGSWKVKIKYIGCQYLKMKIPHTKNPECHFSSKTSAIKSQSSGAIILLSQCPLGPLLFTLLLTGDPRRALSPKYAIELSHCH